MLDSLFNTYAPAINASLAKSGYNSVMAMKDAAAHGTINASSFLGAFNSGLIAVDETSKSNTLFEKYGEEIPIDVVEKCDYAYALKAPEQKTESDKRTDNIGSLEQIEITLTGHIKNKNAELWEMNDFSYKLADAMAEKQPVVLRIGKTIYEDIILVKYVPSITNINEIKFVATLNFAYAARRSSAYDKDTGYNIITNKTDKIVSSLTSSPQYVGSYPAEVITRTDTTAIVGLDKVFMAGNYA